MRQNKECAARRGVKLDKKPRVHPQRNCLVCKGLFHPRRAHQKYCSTACSRQADSENKKALYAKFRAAEKSVGPIEARANLPNDSEFATGKQSRCTLCSKHVTKCKCRCTWCGGPKWFVNGWNEWHHHVCNNSQRHAANANSGPALEVQQV